LVTKDEVEDLWLACRLRRYLGRLDRSAKPGVLPASSLSESDWDLDSDGSWSVDSVVMEFE
jgi:hypothetical protein